MRNHLLPIALPIALATLAACATPDRAVSSWSPVEGRANPTLMFGLSESDNASFRLECDPAGTRLAVFVPRVPRGTPLVEDQQFPTPLRLFFGNREISLGATGTVDNSGGSMVEATLPDPDRFFADLAQQGRLVAVTFAGRTKAPAPTAELVSGFRTRCPARG